jgi:hypothetical protein
MSTGQDLSRDGSQHPVTRDRTPSPARIPSPSEQVKDSLPTVPSSADSTMPTAQQQDIRPLIEPRADG